MKKYEYKIHQEEYMDETPRDWDNLGTMVCQHNRYTLGDGDNAEDELIAAIEKSPKYCESWENSYSDFYRDFSDPQTLLDTAMELDVAIILPLYLYDHSGITMNTCGFSCEWDSGQVGYIYITREKIRKEYSVKRISPQLSERVTGYLVGEVKTYAQYLEGDVWFYNIEEYEEVTEKDYYDLEETTSEGTRYFQECGTIDSLGGIYGYTHAEEEAAEAVKYFTNLSIKEEKEENERMRQLQQSTVKSLVANHVPLLVRQQKMAMFNTVE